MKVGFIGLGTMGFPIAGHLSNHGHTVGVYNRTTSRSDLWLSQFTGYVAKTPSDLAEEVEVLCLCVGGDEDVQAVLLGENDVLRKLRPGDIVLDHTTASAQCAIQMSQLAAQNGVHYLDAPVSGGQSGAEQGILTVMVGGDQESFTQIIPLLGCYAKSFKHLGDSGCGQIAKMMNQICIAGLLQGLSEALAFGERAGIDSQAVIEVIQQGAAQSWQMDNRAATMLLGQYEFGFAVDWMRKDLGIALAQAAKQGSSLPVTALVDQFYADVQNAGGGRWDSSSLLTRLKQSP